MKTLKELKKGCGERCFCKHNKDSLKCGTVWAGGLHLCVGCMREYLLLTKISLPITEFLKTLEPIELENPVSKEIKFLLDLNEKILGEDLF